MARKESRSYVKEVYRDLQAVYMQCNDFLLIKQNRNSTFGTKMLNNRCQKLESGSCVKKESLKMSLLRMCQTFRSCRWSSLTSFFFSVDVFVAGSLDRSMATLFLRHLFSLWEKALNLFSTYLPAAVPSINVFHLLQKLLVQPLNDGSVLFV